MGLVIYKNNAYIKNNHQWEPSEDADNVLIKAGLTNKNLKGENNDLKQR